MIVLETKRLRLRYIEDSDAQFIFELVNQKTWLKFIGDKGVKDIPGALKYIDNIRINMYQKYGFGLYIMERKDDLALLGMCGLIKRDTLDDIDIGFAILGKYARQGYTLEASLALLTQAKEQGIKKIVVITNINNIQSIQLLEKIGLQYEKLISMDAGVSQLKLFSIEFKRQ